MDKSAAQRTDDFAIADDPPSLIAVVESILQPARRGATSDGLGGLFHPFGRHNRLIERDDGRSLTCDARCLRYGRTHVVVSRSGRNFLTSAAT